MKPQGAPCDVAAGAKISSLMPWTRDADNTLIPTIPVTLGSSHSHTSITRSLSSALKCNYKTKTPSSNEVVGFFWIFLIR